MLGPWLYLDDLWKQRWPARWHKL